MNITFKMYIFLSRRPKLIPPAFLGKVALPHQPVFPEAGQALRGQPDVRVEGGGGQGGGADRPHSPRHPGQHLSRPQPSDQVPPLRKKNDNVFFYLLLLFRCQLDPWVLFLLKYLF